MRISDVCRDYFNAFQNISSWKNKEFKANALTTLKILSYFTVVIPVGFAAAYGISSLYGRITKQQKINEHDQHIQNNAKSNLGLVSAPVPQEKAKPVLSIMTVESLLAKAKVYATEEKGPLTDFASLMNYITNVVNDSAFQKDPNAFMAEWKKQRGCSEQYIIPEDTARAFFEREVVEGLKIVDAPLVNVQLAVSILNNSESIEDKSPLLQIIYSDGFLKDPISYMVHLMIERGVGRARSDDGLRAFIISQIPNFADQISSPDGLRLIAKEHYNEKNNKEKIMLTFETSLKSPLFKEHLQNAINEFQQALKEKDDSAIYVAEEGLRTPLQIFEQSEELESYHLSDRAGME